jgi:hypothetical protein
MGHVNLNMIKVYFKVMEKDPPSIKNPLDTLVKNN